jgi:uncharacterized RDD family membrane protein YckC
LTARHTVLTPEHVLIELPPAGLGSRFVALTVDFTIVAGTSSLVGKLLALLLPHAIERAVIATLTFVLTWGYHVYFETRHQGRTPGKRLVGLRVVDGRGLPLTVRQSFVRNIVRALDFAPVAYGLGGLVCRLDGRNRRLGDIAADTLVIRDARPFTYDRRETRGPAFNSLRTPRTLRAIRARIGVAEREHILRLVERADDLLDPVRLELMQDAGAHYRRILGLDDPGLSGENLVRGLAGVLSARRGASQGGLGEPKRTRRG